MRDFIVGVTVRKEVDEATGMEDIVVLEHREEIHPQVLVRVPADRKNSLASYTIPASAHVVAKDSEIYAGAVIAKTTRKQALTKDITGDQRRVSEPFEARMLKGAAEIAKLTGHARGRRKRRQRAPHPTQQTYCHLSKQPCP